MRRLPTIGALLVLIGAFLASVTPFAPASAAPRQDDATTTAPASTTATGEDGSDDAGAASTSSTGDPGRVSVLKVEGLIDPVMADFITRSITEGEEAGLVAVVLQMDSGGTALTDSQMADLVERIGEAQIPIAVWIGPNGSSALGGAAQITGLADVIGISSKSRLGKTGRLFRTIDEADLQAGFADAAERLRTRTVDEKEAMDLGIAPLEAEVLGDLLIDIPGFETEPVEIDGVTRSQPVTVPVFSSLPIQDQLFHTVASPAAAYLLLLIGLCLIVFEMYTAGAGIAGLVGAGCFMLSAYGLSVLSANPIAVGLLALSIFGYTVDVQSGAPRAWSIIGTVALIAGSLTLYDDHPIGWLPLAVGILGVPLAMITGMPAMVRTRFSTPTIGREWMIGEEGDAVTSIDPDGVVRVRGALWRARTNRATPIAFDGPIRVVEVDGLLLEVEPLEGGARDHRDRGRSSGDDAVDDGPVLVDGEPLAPETD